MHQLSPKWMIMICDSFRILIYLQRTFTSSNSKNNMRKSQVSLRSFSTSFIQSIDNGRFFHRPFGWIYIAISILNLVGVPVYMVYMAASGDLFEMEFRFILSFALLFIVFTIIGFISFQLWWNRRRKVITMLKADDEFVAIPLTTNLFQTLGEWVGVWIGLGGFSINLILSLTLGDDSAYFVLLLGLPLIGVNFYAAFLSLILGFLIILITRFIAEQFFAIAAIANNTRQTKFEANSAIPRQSLPAETEVQHPNPPKKGSDWTRYTPPSE